MWPNRSWVECVNLISVPASNAPANAAQDPICLRCCRGTLLTCAHLVVHQVTFSKAAPSHTGPSQYWDLWLVRPRCRTLFLSSLNFIKLLLPRCSSLSRSFCWRHLPSDVCTSPSNLVSFENLVRMLSIWSSRSFTETLNSVGPNMNPWGTPLVADWQLE